MLLDTHALLWWLDGDRRLSAAARRRIGGRNSPILVSAATAWEIATKVRLGRLPQAVDVVTEWASMMTPQGFVALAVSTEHGLRAGSLPGLHQDPFDRMLIAQAQVEDLAMISNERIFDAYGVRRLW